MCDIEQEGKKGQKSERWCFTSYDLGFTVTSINNPCVYLIYQGEVCPKTGRNHIQGYLRFSRVQRWEQVMEWFSVYTRKKVWTIISEGSEEQNRIYCTKSTKDGKPMEVWKEPVELGDYQPTKGKRGGRSDLLEVTAAVTAGATRHEIAQLYPVQFVKYYKGLDELRRELKSAPPPVRSVDVQVLWGETATGKSHRVRTKYPDSLIVTPGPYPFDMYYDHDVIVFEEFDWTKWSVHEMNSYLDKWKCPLHTRYVDRYAVWTKVFILANSNPLDWYANEQYSLIEAFRRRLTHKTEVISQTQEIQLL